MFENIGSKIKKLAEVLCIINAIATAIAGIVMTALTQNGVFLLLMIVGPLLAWVSSSFMYGLGELIENSYIIARNSSLIAKNTINKIDKNPSGYNDNQNTYNQKR